MSSSPSLQPLYSFDGWVIKNIKLSSDVAMIKIRHDKRHLPQCPLCGQKMGENRRLWQVAKDLPLGTAHLVEIIYEAIQGYCINCKHYSTLIPPGIDHHSRATTRLMHYVCRLCRFMPADKVPEFLPISSDTARRWDKKILSKYLPEPDFDNLRIILVDEKSIGPHHHYLTVVLNGETGEVLHLAEGKKKESLEGFFNKLTPQQRSDIEAVGMDRSGAYKSVVTKAVPHAAIVYDKFHIVANYNKAIDEVRRSEWHKADEEHKSFIKGQRYNLFRNPENRKPEQTADLNTLLLLNESLFKAYILKDALKVLWTYVYPKSASKYLDKWTTWAKETGLVPLIKFAKGLDRDRKELLAFIRHRITSAKLEAFNATIARIVRRACGYSDLDYLFLKIRQEGNPVLQI